MDLEFLHRLHTALHHPDPEEAAAVLAEHEKHEKPENKPNAAATADVTPPPATVEEG